MYNTGSCLYNSIATVAMPSTPQCALHGLPLSLYCNRCLQPTCHNCSLLGPHNTPIHALIPLDQAYQRRVQQLNTRVIGIGGHREAVLEKIRGLGAEIERVRAEGEAVGAETAVRRAEIEGRLARRYDRMVAGLEAAEEELRAELNTVNDVCYHFLEVLGVSDHECLLGYERVMEELKEIIDKIEAVLDREVQVGELPKDLSQMRLKLNQIQAYEQLYAKKVSIVQELLSSMLAQLQNIQRPTVNFKQHLGHLEALLDRYSPSLPLSTSLEQPNLRKYCLVCHFCGVLMQDQSINTHCDRNKLSVQMKTAENYYSREKAGVDVNGYCAVAPDVGRFGTGRHWFGEPGDLAKFQRLAFWAGQGLGAEVLAANFSEDDLVIIEANKKGEPTDNAFMNYLSLVLLKLATRAKIEGKNLGELFEAQDLKSRLGFKGYCQVVSMQYILIQAVGMAMQQAQIILNLGNFIVDEKHVEPIKENKKISVRNYEKLMQVVNGFKI